MQREWHATRSGFLFPSGPWWTVPHLPREADVKDVWEPARFAWAYDLIRAHRLSGDPTFARAFYSRLEGWLAASPPFYGVHWSCGQETAIRAIAILHAERELLPADRNDRLALARALSWSGERIADAIQYGLSQRNNHGISESSGLVHLGLRLRHDHPDAATWLESGSRLLEEQIHDQFAEDGWYAQHSFYYTRVALEQALLAQRALQAAGRSLSVSALGLLAAATDLIALLVDAGTGEVPNFGANDGSRVLPISSAPYRDFRPVLTLSALTLRRPLPRDVPADPEVVAWLGGEQPMAGERRADGAYRGAGSGWAVVRLGGVTAFLRAGAFTHRPSHLDLLHLNLSVDGREVIVDPGTFAYNAPPPWQNGLAVASVHNAPMLDDEEPVKKGPRFLWREWPSAVLRTVVANTHEARIVAEIPGRVVREVTIRTSELLVRDVVLDDAVRAAQVTWLLHPELAEADIVRVSGAADVRPREDAIDAWFSPTYGMRVPTRAVRARRERVSTGPLEISATIILRARPS